MYWNCTTHHWFICWSRCLLVVHLEPLTLTVLNFWKFTSYCSLKPLWSGMGEVVPAHTSPTLHPPSPPTVHQLSRLALEELIVLRIKSVIQPPPHGIRWPVISPDWIYTWPALGIELQTFWSWMGSPFGSRTPYGRNKLSWRSSVFSECFSSRKQLSLCFRDFLRD